MHSEVINRIIWTFHECFARCVPIFCDYLLWVVHSNFTDNLQCDVFKHCIRLIVMLTWYILGIMTSLCMNVILSFCVWVWVWMYVWYSWCILELGSVLKVVTEFRNALWGYKSNNMDFSRVLCTVCSNFLWLFTLSGALQFYWQFAMWGLVLMSLQFVEHLVCVSWVVAG